MEEASLERQEKKQKSEKNEASFDVFRVFFSFYPLSSRPRERPRRGKKKKKAAPKKSVGPPGLRPQHLLVRDPPLLVLPRRRPPSRLPQLPAPRHGAPLLAALLGVHLQQHPHPAAELAAPGDAQGARPRVLEEGLDLGAVARGAAGVGAAAGVPEERHRPRELRRPVGPLRLGEARPSLVERAPAGAAPRVRGQGVRVAGRDGVEAAGGAHVEVGADGAAEASWDFFKGFFLVFLREKSEFFFNFLSFLFLFVLPLLLPSPSSSFSLFFLLPLLPPRKRPNSPPPGSISRPHTLHVHANAGASGL